MRNNPRKHSSKFERDWKWFLSVRHLFSFDGKYLANVKYDRRGVSGIDAFFFFDSQGMLMPTRHPVLLTVLIRTKGSVNLHIKMYAEDRAKGTLPKLEFDNICNEVNAPEWISKAVEKQKYKYY